MFLLENGSLRFWMLDIGLAPVLMNSINCEAIQERIGPKSKSEARTPQPEPFGARIVYYINMKQTALLLILFTSFLSRSQDTLSHNKRYQGGETTLLALAEDTFFRCTYPSGELESIRPYTQLFKTTLYKRYYKNGKQLWNREMLNGQANGTTVFFNEKGKEIASFEFKNDTLIDTNFINEKIPFVFGRATYRSVVYGGMVREDGTSNVSRRKGTYMFTPMYTVKLDSTVEEQSMYKHFYTDFNGYYFVCLEKGNFGFFPKYQDIKKVTSQMGAPRPDMGGGSQSQWNIREPIQIDDQFYYRVDLFMNSVGYAP